MNSCKFFKDLYFSVKVVIFLNFIIELGDDSGIPFGNTRF